MASASKSSTPPSQGPPYPPGESKLELTPTELLVTIFGQLSQNDLQSFRDLPNQALVEANRAAHRDMRSLCVTSKRVDRVARPLLLQNITITSPTSLLMLYESLQDSPQLGYHAKQLSFDILLGNVGLCDFLPLPSARIANLLSGWDDYPGECSRQDNESYSNYCCDQILSSCYFEILRRTPRIHRLVLRIQPLDLSSEETAFYPSFMHRPFFKKVESATNRSITDNATEFLPQLTTLQILGDPEDAGLMLHVGNCEPLLRLPTLQHIACSQVWGFFIDLLCKIPDSSRAVPVFKSIKMAEFQDYRRVEGGLFGLGELFPNLESLKLSMRIHDTWDVKGWAGRDLFGELQEALTLMKNLRTLVLEFRYV